MKSAALFPFLGTAPSHTEVNRSPFIDTIGLWSRSIENVTFLPCLTPTSCLLPWFELLVLLPTSQGPEDLHSWSIMLPQQPLGSPLSPADSKLFHPSHFYGFYMSGHPGFHWRRKRVLSQEARAGSWAVPVSPFDFLLFV